jgi:hypothetical protein
MRSPAGKRVIFYPRRTLCSTVVTGHGNGSLPRARSSLKVLLIFGGIVEADLRMDTHDYDGAKSVVLSLERSD